MLKDLEARVVNVGTDKVDIFELPKPRNGYSAFYQNDDTKMLDKKFGLRGQAIVEPSVANELLKATQRHSLGSSLAEAVLRYFAHLAQEEANFIGVREDEFIILSGFDHEDLKAALAYRDDMNGNLAYLRRINVEDQNVLFPVNLQKPMTGI